MEGEEFLASRYREVVDEFIQALLEEWAGDMGQVERNVMGVVLRQEIETRLAPELLALHALLLWAGGDTLARLPAWLDTVQTQLPGDAEFLIRVGRVLDPARSALLEENAGIRPAESEASRAFTDCLWSMAPSVSGPSLEP